MTSITQILEKQKCGESRFAVRQNESVAISPIYFSETSRSPILCGIVNDVRTYFQTNNAYFYIPSLSLTEAKIN